MQHFNHKTSGNRKNCTGFQKQEIGVFKAEEVFRFGVVCQKVELYDKNPDEREDLL